MANFNKDREINLIKYIPDVLSDVDEYKAVMTLETNAKKEQWDKLESIFDSQYILEVPELGISLFEKMHGIMPLDTETLQERRNRIYVLYNEVSPFTRRWFQTSLEKMCGGKSHVSVRYLTETFTVEITFNCVPINILLQCFEWVERVTPYNMLLVNIQSHKANINEYFAIREIQRKGIKVKATEDINMRFNDSERYIAVRPLRRKGIKVKATEDINMRFNDSLRYISASAFNKKAIRVMVAER